MQAASRRIYRFDRFELDAHRRQLWCDGQLVTLQPKALDLLVALVESGGNVLTKDELLNLVWPGQVVEESNLTVHMSALRKALGERKGEHRFVVTQPGRGYRFVADVDDVQATDRCGRSSSDARRTAVGAATRTRRHVARQRQPALRSAHRGRRCLLAR